MVSLLMRNQSIKIEAPRFLSPQTYDRSQRFGGGVGLQPEQFDSES